MRGKGRQPFCICRKDGITPAYAGKSPCRWCSGVGPWDHPRVCGEKQLLGVCKKLFPGSPPRMRGKVFFQGNVFLHNGITPAYAGKSRRKWGERWLRWDHPRVCGEKKLLYSPDLFFRGSPPRMRGKVVQDHHVKGPGGITPAYAGKSPPGCTGFPRCRDHPRVCGEKDETAAFISLLRGSPQRMRGKVVLGFPPPLPPGITPAYAGKRDKRIFAGIQCRDHPRVCGEKCRNILPVSLGQGSPPRMRGKATTQSENTVPSGITPAYAGKRSFCASMSEARRDHPRVCGEKEECKGCWVFTAGSPPRMRGKGRGLYHAPLA